MATAIIGGTGLYQLAGLQLVGEHTIETPLGVISAPIQEGRFKGETVFFLARHGVDHEIPPHLINYRANLWALKQLGVTRVIGVNAVGGIHPDAAPEVIFIPDQVIDYTGGREHTYFTGEAALRDAMLAGQSFTSVHHIDFTYPYDISLRQQIVEAANAEKIAVMAHGVYGCTQGPRLESAAEIQRCQQDGCDLVGMTSMPEAALARELDIPYASICLVVNWAAGLSDQLISIDEIHRVIESGMIDVERLIRSILNG